MKDKLSQQDTMFILVRQFKALICAGFVSLTGNGAVMYTLLLQNKINSGDT